MNLDHYLRSASPGQPSIGSRFSDIALAGLLVAIIALMILPLPTLVIDSLVALNIAIGIMLVLMSIYIGSALQFSAFPSVLLISTLFRLALSVATTRMILLHGDAGNIISTFGDMVAGGNLVVGLVVFLIITLVQFLVIAKGAERVAEVGARFTLDAMPGKQLSIDSDLRSGLIDKTEARAKRRELELESKLHGSMDGAMKFVKGDAIAGIVIIIVNLLGGLAIGIWQLNMAAGDAMTKYSILTIGDGLVAQIPALLGAMSAGLIVTRATDNQADRHLGDSIQKQFAAIPRVMLVAGGICFLMAMVPGFPSMVFIALSLTLTISGGLLVPALRQRLERINAPGFQRILEGKVKKHRAVDPVKSIPVESAVPLLLELPGDAATEGADVLLQQAVVESVARLQMQSGVPLPEVKIHFYPQRKAGWELFAYEVPIHSVPTLNASLMVEEVVPAVELALRHNATLFLGIQESSQLLQLASDSYPDIVKETLRVIPVQGIAAVLRNLVAEEVSIRNLRGIFEALVEASQVDREPLALTEHVRAALARQTCHRYAPEGSLKVVTLSPALEEQLLQAMKENTDDSSSPGMQPAFAERVRQIICTVLDEQKPQALACSYRLTKTDKAAYQRHTFRCAGIVNSRAVAIHRSYDCPSSCLRGTAFTGYCSMKTKLKICCLSILLTLSSVNVVWSAEIPGFDREVLLISREQTVQRFVTELFGRINVPVDVAPEITGTVNGDFKGTAASVFDQVARTFQVALYFDGSKAYIYPANQSERKIMRMSSAVARRVVANSQQLGLPDTRNTVSSTDMGLVVTGSERFHEQVEQIMKAVAVDKPAPKADVVAEEPGDDFRMFKLRYAWAHDVVMEVAGQQITVPGVASTLRTLIEPGAVASSEILRVDSGNTLQGLRGQGLQSSLPSTSVDNAIDRNGFLCRGRHGQYPYRRRQSEQCGTHS